MDDLRSWKSIHYTRELLAVSIIGETSQGAATAMIRTRRNVENDASAFLQVTFSKLILNTLLSREQPV